MKQKEEDSVQFRKEVPQNAREARGFMLSKVMRYGTEKSDRKAQKRKEALRGSSADDHKQFTQRYLRSIASGRDRKLE